MGSFVYFYLMCVCMCVCTYSHMWVSVCYYRAHRVQKLLIFQELDLKDVVSHQVAVGN